MFLITTAWNFVIENQSGKYNYDFIFKQHMITGSRSLYINNKRVYKKKMMIRLIGNINFTLKHNNIPLLNSNNDYYYVCIHMESRHQIQKRTHSSQKFKYIQHHLFVNGQKLIPGDNNPNKIS
jgi:hypothetical protein